MTPSVKKSLVVDAPQETAFRVFTADMTRWWPLASHKVGKVEAREAIVEPRAGGRWFERGVDGSECEWGKVLVWEPPSRIVLSWDLDSRWQYDASLGTEVEVRFVAEGRKTRVELEHRKLERFGEAAEQMRGALGGEGGWQALLDAFARALAES